MPAGEPANPRHGYLAEAWAVYWQSLLRLARPPSHSRRAEAARHWARRSLVLTAILAALIVFLVFALDAFEIGLMPPRGTASLWPLRVLTDFGKSQYVLWALGLVLIVIVLLLPRLRGLSRSIWISLGTRFQYLFFAVMVPVIAGEAIKGIVGRGRPFVGGAANPLNFALFSWKEAYSSFPSGHATAAFALAFAVVSVWPGSWLVMSIYAIAIALTRLVLLAHHPSDVVGGALLGVVGAMAVRYHFAARRLAFTIEPDGAIAPLPGPSIAHVKKVAREAIAP